MVGETAVVVDGRVGVLAGLRARRGELVDEIFARVRGDAFGGVGAQDVEYLAGLRAAVGAAVEYALEGIERGEGWAGAIPALAVEQARRAARVGVSLDTVLRRYVVGHTMLGEFVLQEAERDGGGAATAAQRGAVREALRAQAVVLDRLLDAITRAYEQELLRAARAPGERRAARVRGLLEQGAAGPGAGEDGGGGELERDLDYALEGWHLGAIVLGARGQAEQGGEGEQPGQAERHRPAGQPTQARHAAERAVRELAAAAGCRVLSVAQGDGSVWAWLGAEGPFAFARVERQLAGAGREPDPGAGGDPGVGDPGVGEGVAFAFGEPGEGFAGWRLTHQQAQAALVVARRRPRTVTRYGDVALLASVLKDELLAGALRDLYIAPLVGRRDGGAVLLRTLRAYLAAERSVSSAAAALGVVRKTVESRLRTVEERLGRTLHPCPAELEIALLLEELGAGSEV
jgi:PucR C-terminal helix-turn-helix domain